MPKFSKTFTHDEIISASRCIAAALNSTLLLDNIDPRAQVVAAFDGYFSEPHVGEADQFDQMLTANFLRLIPDIALLRLLEAMGKWPAGTDVEEKWEEFVNNPELAVANLVPDEMWE